VDWLDIDAKYVPAFTRLGLNSYAAVSEFFAEPQPTRDKTVSVKPKKLQLPDGSTLEIFYKQYEYEHPEWRFIGRRSKARCEFENYATFRALDIPCPDRVACGEQRDWLGRLRRAFVITTAILRAWTLPQFVEEFCPNRATDETQELRNTLVRQLAAMTRRIHDAHFFHNDLYWRNILVTWQPPDTPKVWWIDCPRGRFARLRPHRLRIKDLASLDKAATDLATSGERLLFVKEYLGKQHLDHAVEQLGNDALAYRKQRWPDEWH